MAHKTCACYMDDSCWTSGEGMRLVYLRKLFGSTETPRGFKVKRVLVAQKISYTF